MATIDLIVLGMLKQEPRSAYELQKLVEYRNISKWVRISTQSIYKKVIQLEEKGYVKSNIVKEGKMPEKAIYSLTAAGEKEFEDLMEEISESPIHFFLDFNAVIVNLASLAPETQKTCLSNIEAQVKTLRSELEESLRTKKDVPEIPKTGMAVLQQQLMLAQTIEAWVASLKRN